MMARGYVVVATDYPGLGTPGIHPYLIGVSEGRAVLDSVRAARELPDAGASDRFAVWGHSQGGHASLYTGELAASYAPELKLVGVAAAAPATNLIELFDADKSSATGKELTAMALYSWSELYHDPATSLVDPSAMPAFEQLAHDCIEWIAEFAAIENAEKPLNREQFLKADPTLDRAVALGDAEKHARPGRRRSAGVHRARDRRHHRQARDHQAVRRGAVQAGDAGRFRPAARRQPHLRRQRQRRPGAGLDDRALQGRAARPRSASDGARPQNTSRLAEIASMTIPMKMTRKMKNSTLEIWAAPRATPVKPSAPATSEINRQISAHFRRSHAPPSRGRRSAGALAPATSAHAG